MSNIDESKLSSVLSPACRPSCTDGHKAFLGSFLFAKKRLSQKMHIRVPYYPQIDRTETHRASPVQHSHLCEFRWIATPHLVPQSPVHNTMAFSFGAPAATPAPAASTSTSLFGGFNSTAQQPSSQAAAPATGGFNLFGSKPATTAPAAGTTSLFGGASTTPAAAPSASGTGTGLFGSTTTGTGTAGTTGTTSLFGNTNNNSTTGTSLFAGFNQQPGQQQQNGQQQPGQATSTVGTGTGSLFGNNNNQASTSLFGQPAQTTQSSLFGNNNQQQTQPQQTLGTNNNIGSSLFGNASTQQPRAQPTTRSKRTLQERLQLAAQGIIPSQDGFKLRVRTPCCFARTCANSQR